MKIAVYVLLLSALCAHGAPDQSVNTQAADTVHVWEVSASDQVHANLRSVGSGRMCLDYDFGPVSGYAVMRRKWPRDWPRDFTLQTTISGQGAGNDLQIKFTDATGDNVWWITRPNFAPTSHATRHQFGNHHVRFAWGPTSDQSLTRTDYLEWVVVAGKSGARQGSLCAGETTLTATAPSSGGTISMHTEQGGSVWNLGAVREFSGLLLYWPKAPRAYTIQVSDDGRHWRTLRHVRRTVAGTDVQYLHEQQARWIRLRIPSRRYVPQLSLRTSVDWPDLNSALIELAQTVRKGDIPRAWIRQQNYWTVIGSDGGGSRSALLSEDGALELFPGGPSLEPALLRGDGKLLTWAQASITHELPAGGVPIPRVHWIAHPLALSVEAGASIDPTDPGIYARYTLRNDSRAVQRTSLLLALRPWQVNPPQQFLNLSGGVSPIPSISWNSGALHASGQSIATTPLPSRVSAAPFDAGLDLDALLSAQSLRYQRPLQDPQRLASALLRYDLELRPGESRSVLLATNTSSNAIDTRLDEAIHMWRLRFGHLRVELPQTANHLEDRMHAALAHILISRDEAWLRPGTRSYARTWIRDGAMMIGALLRMGESHVATDFIDQYRKVIFTSGKVPCCYDSRGADPVAENDSHGQYLYAVAEVWRHTQDRAVLQRHWPTVQRTMTYLESLRQRERGPANRGGARERFFGLMPPSISHEGYSDKPAYSYWDNLWALRGYKDAVNIALALEHSESAALWRVWLKEFESDLARSFLKTSQNYEIPYLAGAADRGDFDATSTSIAFNPTQAHDLLPTKLLEGTYDRYVVTARARASGEQAYTDYTPYELRNVSALIRMGRSLEAHELLDFFYRDARPNGWYQWAEVVSPNPRQPRFLGDMPHAWVSSDFLSAALDMLAYEREADGDVVLAAGILPTWRTSGDIAVAGLSTIWGQLDYRLLRTQTGWQLHLDRTPQRLPHALRLAWPGDTSLPQARTADGQVLKWDGRELLVPSACHTIELFRS